MHELFMWTHQGLITTAWHRQMFVDATDHESRVGSLLLLKRGRDDNQVCSSCPLYSSLCTADNHQTDKINVNINCLTPFPDVGLLR